MNKDLYKKMWDRDSIIVVRFLFLVSLTIEKADVTMFDVLL